MRSRVLLAAAALAASASAALASSVSPQFDVLAAVARASTPVRARPVPSAALPASLRAALPGMWDQARAADAPSNSSDCQAFLLQYELSVRLLPERAPLLEAFDALRLATECGITPPPAAAAAAAALPATPVAVAAAHDAAAACPPTATFYVDYAAGDDGAAGSAAAPFKTLARGVAATRVARPAGAGAACLLLRAGVHYLGATVYLGAADSGLAIAAFPGEAAWVSGGVPLGALAWAPYNVAGASNVWVADVPAGVPLTAMPGLQTLDAGVPTRLWRAMYPNYDVEQFIGDLPDMHEVQAWLEPPVMAVPTLFYKDLSALGLKNDSTMVEYNIYATGRGGPCAHWANDGDTYVCSNNTAGGWEFIEQKFADAGRLGFPIGLRYDPAKLPSFANWTIPPAAVGDWRNAPTITVWHNQGWYQATYAVTAHDAATSTLTMSDDGIMPSGGWQGGRTMENVDPYNMSSPLGSGAWYVSNVFEELDAPGEYYFDAARRKLFVFYNASAGTPPPAGWALVASQLEVFFNVTGSPAAPVADVSWTGLGFRDQRTGQLDRWVDPSGGDWGLRRAGLLYLEGTERATVAACTFYRTDANAVFLDSYARNATVIDNEFAYTGFSAVVTFGATMQDDATEGTQPWGTVIAYNHVHEIGTYQLQSSAWFTSRAALTRAEGNVVYNIPRAAINFNDACGGGNNVSRVSIFNTCRQSGDHGPINSWDRMPFATKIRSIGGEASYSAADTEISSSMIIANYGAAQSVDNDDGSSWYHTHDNFFYDASGFKMDYGGHDSRFHSNVVIARHGQNCLGTASFVAGHATQIYDNDCVVYGTERVDDLFENCNTPGAGQAMVRGFNNRFYTPNANASATCDCCGLRPLAMLPKGLEDNFTSSFLPSAATVIAWGRAKLDMPV